MDPERYSKVRELFLAVEEISRDQQLEFLQNQTQGDEELVAEVLSLLDEHDMENARIEGDSAKAPAFPTTSVDDSLPLSAAAASGDDTQTGPAQQTTSQLANETRAKRPSGASAAPFLPSPSSVKPKTHSDTPRSQTPRSRPDRNSIGEKPSTRKGKFGSAQVTQHSSQRTHATPRYTDDSPRPRKNAGSSIWQSRAKRHRRFNSGWLWLAAILPTALIGFWTYSKVTHSLTEAARNELVGVADSIEISVQRFLNDQARLAESWSRQGNVRESIEALVELSKTEDAVKKLKASDHSNTIQSELIEMSETPGIKYVVWNRSGMIIASWLKDQADVGGMVAPEGAGNLARCIRGETVLFGPQILQEDGTGFQPETKLPVMAVIMPVRNQDDQIIATMLIRGFGMYDEFDTFFRQASTAGGLDVYAVDRNGLMVTNSPQATTLLTQSVLSLEGKDYVSCNLRVSDPGKKLVRDEPSQRSRRSQPLTYSVAGAASGNSDSQLADYRNYAGIDVVGAWRWVDDWGLGVVVERSSESAFATAGIVRFGFILLALVLTITALVAAARIAQRTAMAQAAIHPLSRYELDCELGSGGMGVVYRAKHSQLGRDTALKVLRGDRDNLEDRLRFDREAKLAASLSSPHTVTIYDYGRSDEDEAYCVMEFLKGITLYDVVARSGYQTYGRALFILRQICDSLGEAHQLGLVHRDVKPQNIMLSLDPSVGDWAVVFDFGLAKPLVPEADAYQTAETIWAGTPMYMAPERYREPNKIDPRSDIYSVGCISYFLLTGRPPFIECDPESLFALVLTEQPISLGVHREEDVPAEIAALVSRCMAKNVEDRYQTIEELAAELDVLIKKHPWSVDQSRSWWRIHGEEIK